MIFPLQKVVCGVFELPLLRNAQKCSFSIKKKKKRKAPTYLISVAICQNVLSLLFIFSSAPHAFMALLVEHGAALAMFHLVTQRAKPANKEASRSVSKAHRAHSS
jgi:hypothetical protein